MRFREEQTPRCDDKSRSKGQQDKRGQIEARQKYQVLNEALLMARVSY